MQKKFTKIFFVIFALLLFIIPNLSSAEKIKKVYWAVTEWKDLTNKDGTGLYNEIIDKVFGYNNIEVVREFVPWKRAITVLKKKKVDMTGGIELTEEYTQSKYPVFENAELVIFHKDKIKKWEGIKTLKDKQGVWMIGYIDNMDAKIKPFLKGIENPSRTAALNMLISDRVDYCIDTRHTLQKTIDKMNHLFNIDDYRVETVSELKLYMSFTKTERGRKIRDIYDKGIEKLYRSGELQKMYNKWKNQLPTLDIK